MEQKFLAGIKTVSKFIILSLILLLVTSMLLASIDLYILFGQAVISPSPYPLLINIDDLYTFFNMILVIMVGYELLKSMKLILQHDIIPVKSVLKIAAIAMANKFITLNVKHVDMEMMIGLGVILLSIGVAFFFYSRDSEAEK